MNKRKIYIISELHPQWGGDLDDLKTMALQSKIGGADAVKIQLYDTMKLHGNSDRQYLQLSDNELVTLDGYCKTIGIPLNASVFDWKQFERYHRLCLSSTFTKIAARTVRDDSDFVKDMVESAAEKDKDVFISHGNNEHLKYAGYSRVKYFYTLPNYPGHIGDLKLPEFQEGLYEGYSDHCPGLTACYLAIAKGAKYIEKHFTLSKGMQCATEKAHVGAMDLDELRQLKAFVNDVQRIRIS